MNKEICPLPNTLKEKSERLLTELEFKSPLAADLVKFFRKYTDQETWETSNHNSNIQTRKITGAFFTQVNNEYPFCSLKDWHPNDSNIPSLNCYLTLSFYKNKDHCTSSNLPELRLQLDRHDDEIISCDHRGVINRFGCSLKINIFIDSVLDYFKLNNKDKIDKTFFEECLRSDLTEA